MKRLPKHFLIIIRLIEGEIVRMLHNSSLMRFNYLLIILIKIKKLMMLKIWIILITFYERTVNKKSFNYISKGFSSDNDSE